MHQRRSVIWREVSYVPILLLENCSPEERDKFIHPIFHKKLFANAKKNHSRIPNNNKQFCTIKCQDLFIKEFKTSAYNMYEWWSEWQDRSESVFLTCLNSHEYFSKWRDPHSTKKESSGCWSCSTLRIKRLPCWLFTHLRVSKNVSHQRPHGTSIWLYTLRDQRWD